LAEDSHLDHGDQSGKERTMESPAPATAAPGVLPIVVSPLSLAMAFTRVPDPWRSASAPYPLAALLSLAVTAILANHLWVLAIAQ
jgi:hypothetical protein